MASSNLTKCTKAELADFKKKVIFFLEDYGIDTTCLDIRGFRQYGGDVRVYTNNYIELVNKKSSFRRENTIKNKDGSIQYEGARGHHSVRLADPIIFNRDDWNEFLEGKNDKYEFWDFTYKELDGMRRKEQYVSPKKIQ